MRRMFIAINALIVAIVAITMLTHDQGRLGDGLYVIALGLICTIPVLTIKSYRGKHSLLLVFMAYYFGAFGLKDITNLIAHAPTATLQPDSLLSAGEIAILVGAICFIIAYLATAKFSRAQSTGILTREWSPKVMLTLGIVLWAVGYYLTVFVQFSMGDSFSGVSVSPMIGGFISLLIQLQFLGSLTLIYLFLTTRSRVALIVLLITMLADFGLGFIGDSKELAVRSPLLFLFSYVLLRERLPLIHVVAFIFVAGLIFNVFSSYRTLTHSAHQSRSDAFKSIDTVVGKIAEEDKSPGERISEGLSYFADRITLKQSVELILIRAGKDVEFQNGRTIKPLLYAFVPRFILPDKEDSSMTGRLFNQEFKISASAQTKIATSQVGELYWNYGWPGLVIGMLAIGTVMATIASALRLDTVQTLPRFLFLLMSVYVLTLRFETALAQNYTIWARAALLLLLLNLLIPKAKRDKNDAGNTSARHVKDGTRLLTRHSNRPGQSR